MTTAIVWLQHVSWDGVSYGPGDVATVEDDQVRRLVETHYARVAGAPPPPVTKADPLPQYVDDAELEQWALDLQGGFQQLLVGHTHSTPPASLVDAKGDLLAGSSNDTLQRLPVGANGRLLVADSTQPLGLRWTDTLPNPLFVARAGGQQVMLSNTSNAVDAKRWQFVIDANGNMHIETVSDANAAVKQVVSLNRTGPVSLDGIRHASGNGSPEGVVTAGVGARYADKDATNGAVEWIKRSGSGNTGWRVVYGDTEWRTITGNLENGWTAAAAFLRRTPDAVWCSLVGLNGAAATSDTIYTLPLGFQGHQAVFARLSGVDGTLAKTLQAAGAQINYGNVNGGRAQVNGLQVSGSWAPTNAAAAHLWPANLPGIAT